jgi:hypothetical protein
MDEIENFSLRCIDLEKSMHKLRELEESNRVWMAVIYVMIRKITNNNQFPEEALKQFINAITEENYLNK